MPLNHVVWFKGIRIDLHPEEAIPRRYWENPNRSGLKRSAGSEQAFFLKSNGADNDTSGRCRVSTRAAAPGGTNQPMIMRRFSSKAGLSSSARSGSMPHSPNTAAKSMSTGSTRVWTPSLTRQRCPMAETR